MNKRHKRGFTLIELTITIAVGAILLGTLGSIAQVHYKTLVQNRNFLIAYNLARRQMAIMNNDAYPAVAAETALTPDAGFPNFIPTQEVTSVDTIGANSLRQVCIRVREVSLAGPVLITIYEYRSDILNFGDGI